MKFLRILHTSDWHIGKKLKEHDRADEFRKFFAWLEDVVDREKPDAIIVAGDVFDSRNPSAESQEMYYSFFGKIAGGERSCRNAVIISGNHDSPALIDAPAGVMGRCNIHVIGRSREDEIITLTDSDGKPEMIVCAVPFLHDSELRTANAGDTFDITRKIQEGIKNHYAEIFARAREIRGDYDIPIVAAGHLFLEAGKTRTDEGERSMYLGTAVKVGTDIFPDDIAYIALGHLHSPQAVGRANIRYSGSPIALTFGEWGVPKTVSIIDFDGRNFAGVREIEIPMWQKMKRISGDMAKIEADLRGLMSLNESVWAEVTYTGDTQPGDIQQELEEIVKESAVEVISIIDKGEYISVNDDGFGGKTLDDIDPVKMLRRKMDSMKIPEEKRTKMEELYGEILREISAEEKLS